MRKLRIFNSLMALSLLLPSVSCSNFLTVESIGKSTIASFFAEVSGLAAAGEGLHDEMESFFDSYYIKYATLMGSEANIMSVSADEGDVYLYNYEMKTEYISTYPRNVWAHGWSVVTNANNIIYYAPQLREKFTLESDRKTIDKVLGWGYFARGLAHWCLCNCYAQPWCYTPDASHIGVPVLTHVPGFDEMIARKTVAEVYKQVLSDVNEAYELLGDEPSVTDPYHIGGIACEALLARIYLYKGDYANAEKYSRKVMDKVQLSPRSEYVDMFRNPFNTPGTETILRFDQYDNSSTLTSSTDPTRNGQDYYPCPAMISKYEGGDIRRELYKYVAEDCEPEAYRGKTYDAVCKYCPYKSIVDEKTRTPNTFLFRVSEMYLIHAEAVANGTAHDFATAASDIKALIGRACGVDPSTVSLSYSDLDSVNAFIEKERMRELCFEGHTFFDSIRRGKGIDRPAESNSMVKSIKFGDYRLVLPIDQMEMQANEVMVQNEGYSTGL